MKIFYNKLSSSPIENHQSKITNFLGRIFLIFLLVFVLHSSFFICFAQQSPVLNHGLFNPYLHNSAYAGTSSYSPIFLNVRDQWREMPGSPFFVSLSVDGQLRNENSGVGFMIQNDRQPLIQNFSGMFTFGHSVNFNQNHSIRLALSGGLFHNSINLAGIKAASPTESTLMEKNN